MGCIDKSECDQKKKFLTPRQVHGLLNIQICQCYAGHHHSLAISLSGKVYGWGENIHKVLGDLVTDEDRKKGITKKNILYFPEVLPLNKYLVVIIEFFLENNRRNSRFMVNLLSILLIYDC